MIKMIQGFVVWLWNLHFPNFFNKTTRLPSFLFGGVWFLFLLSRWAFRIRHWIEILWSNVESWGTATLRRLFVWRRVWRGERSFLRWFRSSPCLVQRYSAVDDSYVGTIWDFDTNKCCMKWYEEVLHFSWIFGCRPPWALELDQLKSVDVELYASQAFARFVGTYLLVSSRHGGDVATANVGRRRAVEGRCWTGQETESIMAGPSFFHRNAKIIQNTFKRWKWHAARTWVTGR